MLNHKKNCSCCVCKNERGEYRIHKDNCSCCICRAIRGETKGRNSYNFGNIILRERRVCICGCRKTFVCKINSAKRYINRHNLKFIHSFRTKKSYQVGAKSRQLVGWWKDREATRRKMRKPKSEIHKQNIRLSKLGKKNPMFGIDRKGRKNPMWGNHKKLSRDHLTNILKALHLHPNKFETKALFYLNVIYEDKFIYTGDGSFIVNNRSADAYSKNLNTVALFNGIYWHLKKQGFKITEENKRFVEKIESQPFLDAGYKVIFIWEDELDRLQGVAQFKKSAGPGTQRP